MSKIRKRCMQIGNALYPDRQYSSSYAGALYSPYNYLSPTLNTMGG